MAMLVGLDREVASGVAIVMTPALVELVELAELMEYWVTEPSL